jgi:type IV pilus assembly protein PilO
MILGVLDDFFEWPTWQKLTGLAGAVVLVGYLDWIWFYGPRAEILAELESNVNTRQAELDTRLAKTNARADAERELRDLTAELKRAQARLPDQREIADLLTNVAASGRSAGLEIVLFRQKPEIYRDFYAEVPVEMQMRGTYHDVARFLDNVKRLDRIVNVTDIKLARPRVEGDQVKLEASCTTTTFRFLDEAERQRLRDQQKKDTKKDPGKSA